MGAISTNAAITSLLKVYYKDGVQNLFYRNSPVLAKISKERVEGKSQNFNAMYGHGGACAGDFTKALSVAASVPQDVEYAVTPGQMFSVYTMNAKEVQASLTQKGAYMKVAGAKMFAASESFRKMMAASLYGRGFGEIAKLTAAYTFVANTAIDITLPNNAIMAISVGSVLAEKSSVGASSVNTELTVNKISGTTVNVTPSLSFTGAIGDIVCFAGSMNAGNPILPMGLAGWLPTIGGRTGAAWNTYIGTSFFGVNRSINPDKLAGNFYAAGTGEKLSTSVQKLILLCRRNGSKADLIAMNDEDFLTLAQEIQTTNTYFTATSTKEKRKANVGISDVSASFSTSTVENIYDDPYCPKGTFYVLDTGTVKLYTYTNVDKLNDGVTGNEAGKEDPIVMNDEGQEKTPYGLIIDNYLNVQSGTATVDGPSVNVTLQMFGSFVVENTSDNGVGLFDGAVTLE